MTSNYEQANLCAELFWQKVKVTHLKIKTSCVLHLFLCVGKGRRSVTAR